MDLGFQIFHLRKRVKYIWQPNPELPLIHVFQSHLAHFFTNALF